MAAISDKIDPVMMNRAIANGVLADLKNDGRRPDALAALSLVRLLEMYAADRFEDNRHVGILEQETFEDFNALDNSKAYGRLRKALESAREQLGNSREAFVDEVRPLLAHFATESEEAGIDLSADKVASVVQFLTALSKALTEAE